MKKEMDQRHPADNNLYILIDGTAVASEEVDKVGRKYTESFRILAYVLFVLGGILLIQFIIDIVNHGTGWGLMFLTEGVILGTGIVFLLIYVRTDPKLYGISILNYQHRIRYADPRDALIYNDIEADVILELFIRKGNLFFIDSVKKRWQFRSKNNLSAVYGPKDFADLQILKDGSPLDSTRAETSDAELPPVELRIVFADAEHPAVEISCKSEAVALQCVKELSLLKTE